jgi:hypothetical protein
MALPARERIFVSVENALMALPELMSVRRMATGAPDSFPDIVIDDGGESVLGQSFYGTQARLKLNLIGSVIQPELLDADLDSGAETHRQMNIIEAAVRVAMFSLASADNDITQVTLGDLDTRVAVGAEQRAIDFVRTFYLDYNTLTLDPNTITDL